MKTVLAYGDSNTWGAATVARPDDRYAYEERWPGVMAATLGGGWRVIEEGLPGRTTVHDDPVEGAYMNGKTYLMPCLRSHRPLDVVAIMLGSNDLKARFAVPASGHRRRGRRTRQGRQAGGSRPRWRRAEDPAYRAGADVEPHRRAARYRAHVRRRL